MRFPIRVGGRWNGPAAWRWEIRSIRSGSVAGRLPGSRREIVMRKIAGLLVLCVAYWGTTTAQADTVPQMIKKLQFGKIEDRRQAARELGLEGPAAKSAVKALTDAAKVWPVDADLGKN